MPTKPPPSAAPSNPPVPVPAPRKASRSAASLLGKLGLHQPIDYALYMPLRYEDETRITSLRSASAGQTVQFVAEVSSSEVLLRPRRQLLATVHDAGVRCTLRFFHFQLAMQKTLSVGAVLRIRGELRIGNWGWEMVHPTVSADTGSLPEALTPFYPATAGLPQAYLRKAIWSNVERADLRPTVPAEIEKGCPWVSYSLQQAVHFLHKPSPQQDMTALEERTHPAWLRLKAEELLAQQLSQRQARMDRARLHAPSLSVAEPQALTQRLLALLPFALTQAQQRVLAEIKNDLQGNRPMHRLLQGDVGSGKTVVAALAAAQCIESGHQCALMVPTEILAEQHFRKLTEWFTALGVKVAWLAGAQKNKERKAVLAQIEQGETPLVVGTHAVLSEHVRFAQLGLVIIDEQHRFGVKQRLALRAKMQTELGSETTSEPAGAATPLAAETPALMEPHLLMMSATPIPRTLAMSYYADLDVSVLDQLPPGRTPVLTKLLAQERKNEIISRIQNQVEQGRQVYWVCPLIEESEALDLVHATETHALLRAALPQTTRVGLLHSKMPAIEKQKVMEFFVANRIHILVATTVVEVGVDVPNATLMVIEHAERFGLSQLHQLRGRVGRGHASSTCILLYSKGEHGFLGAAAKQRLHAMRDSQDGFEIARRDLEIRGPGEFLGARQSGQALLRFADLNKDIGLLEWARQAAITMLAQHPTAAQAHIARWYGEKTQFLGA